MTVQRYWLVTVQVSGGVYVSTAQCLLNHRPIRGSRKHHRILSGQWCTQCPNQHFAASI